MRHAFLIIAHERPEELSRLIRAIDDSRNDIYVHVDATSSMDLKSLRGAANNSTLTLIDRTKVTWGGSSQIRVELDLFDAAYRHGPYRYYHLLSGVDYPVKSNDEIHRYFEEHDGLNFIQPVESLPRQHQRYDQYHLLQDTLIGKKRNFWKYLDFASCQVQQSIGIHRWPKDRVATRYINWVSVTDEVVSRLAERRDGILRRYRFTYCCDEIFLLDELRGTGLESTIAPQGNLRFIEWAWHSKHDSSPRTLEIEDLAALQDPNIMFARKFLLPQSAELYDAIDDIRSGRLADTGKGKGR